MISEQRKALFSSGRKAVDHQSTQEEMEFVLSLGKDAHGDTIKVSEFDAKGVKTLENMFQEIQQQDMTLTFNILTGRVERHARSIRLIITDTKRRIRYLEIERRYATGKSVRPHPPLVAQEYTLRETIRMHEDPDTVAIRMLEEEVQEFWNQVKDSDVKNIEPIWLRLIQTYKSPEMRSVFSEAFSDSLPYESSVYYGVVSVVKVHKYDLNTELLLGKEEMDPGDVMVIQDRGGKNDASDNYVDIYLKAFSID